MVVTAPTGTVSFLFTDVEGSTKAWEADPEGMAASLSLHDQIMRSAIGANGGHVFSTAGDAFAVAFSSDTDAIEAAVRVQLDLLSAPWPGPAIKVRMGIHAGEAQERDGDYFGPVLNRAARIMSAGHGGQILLSSVTASAADVLGLNDLGTHHLKDLDEPEHVFEVRHPDLPVVDRPIKSLDVRRTNLPDYLTSFVGRKTQLDELGELISDHRLVALTGVGGTGKTRLAVEGARRAALEMPDGAWIVELAPVTNPNFIMTTIGETWGLRPGEGASIEDVVVRYLWSRELLIVIDNCEHLLDASAAAIKFLLDACPNLRIVATSRESLGVSGEALLRVPSLGLADATHTIQESEAALLFLDRAVTARPDFEPDDGQLADVERICTRIDGIPLGLELAAARLRSMTVRELADRLDDSFRILSGSAKTSLPRQRTLHATIDWSYDLLKPAERAMFRRLSIFTGGFDLGAAEAVCVGDDVEDWEIVDHLDSLVDKSLVIPEHDSDRGTRYRILEPVRQYGQEQLADTAEPVTYRRAHAVYFADFVATASPGLRGRDQMTCIRRIDEDYENIRAAFATCLETADLDTYLDMSFGLFSYWMHKGMQIEGINTSVAGLEVSERADKLRQAKAWWGAAILSAEVTDPDGVDRGRRGLAVAHELGDPNAIGRMELALGAAIRHATTDEEYLEHLLEARRLLEAHSEPNWWNPVWERGLIQLLFAAYLPPTDERSREHTDEALAVFETYGDRNMLAAALADSMGWYYLGEESDKEWALANARRAVVICAEIDSPNWFGHALQGLGLLLKSEGDLSEAMRQLVKAAALLESVGDLHCWAHSSRVLARCEVDAGEVESGRTRLLAIISQLPVLPMQEVTKPRILDAAVEVLLGLGRTDQAGIVLGAAVANPLPDDFNYLRGPELEDIRESALSAIGESKAEHLLDEGAAMSIDEAIAKAVEFMAEPASVVS